VLRKIYGLKRADVTGGWRRLHNEELFDLYSSPNIIRVIIEKNMGGACSMYGGREEENTGLGWGELREGGYLEDPSIDGKIILRSIFRKWERGGMDWIDLAQDRDRWRAVVNAVKNFRFP